jgi:hypothetical protein
VQAYTDGFVVRSLLLNNVIEIFNVGQPMVFAVMYTVAELETEEVDDVEAEADIESFQSSHHSYHQIFVGDKSSSRVHSCSVEIVTPWSQDDDDDDDDSGVVPEDDVPPINLDPYLYRSMVFKSFPLKAVRKDNSSFIVEPSSGMSGNPDYSNEDLTHLNLILEAAITAGKLKRNAHDTTNRSSGGGRVTTNQQRTVRRTVKDVVKGVWKKSCTQAAFGEWVLSSSSLLLSPRSSLLLQAVWRHIPWLETSTLLVSHVLYCVSKRVLHPQIRHFVTEYSKLSPGGCGRAASPRTLLQLRKKSEWGGHLLVKLSLPIGEYVCLRTKHSSHRTS